MEIGTDYLREVCAAAHLEPTSSLGESGSVEYYAAASTHTKADVLLVIGNPGSLSNARDWVSRLRARSGSLPDSVYFRISAYGFDDRSSRVWATYDCPSRSSLASEGQAPEARLVVLAELALRLSMVEVKPQTLAPTDIWLDPRGLPPRIVDLPGGRRPNPNAWLDARNDRYLFNPVSEGGPFGGKRADWRPALGALTLWSLGVTPPSWESLVNDGESVSEAWLVRVPQDLDRPLRTALQSLMKSDSPTDRHLADLAFAVWDLPQVCEYLTTREGGQYESWLISQSRISTPGPLPVTIPDRVPVPPGPQDLKEDPNPSITDVGQLLPADCSAPALAKVLDELVIGQDIAKQQISVLLSMHLAWFKSQDRRHRAPNAIAIGPTGVGKTHSLRVAAAHLRLPFVVVDATSLVPSGIVGLQVEDVLEELVTEAGQILLEAGITRFADDDIQLAQRGIVLVDEFDKIRKAPKRDDFGKEHVQRRLLKLTEGSILPVGVKSHTDRTPRRSIDTSGILFIASGAFEGIDSQAIRNERPPALQRRLTNLDQVIAADVISYGFLPELVARMQTIVRYEGLTTDQLLEILENPNTSPAAVWENYFDGLGKQLSIPRDSLTAIASHASLLGLGARGLQQVLFPLLASVAFDFESSPDHEFVLDVSRIKEGLKVGK